MATVGSAIVCDRLRLYGNSYLCDRLRFAICDRLRFAICDPWPSAIIWKPALSFDEHIMNTVSSCFASLCKINRINHLFDSKSSENVIHTLVFSRLFYCSPVWSSTSKKNVSKLQHVQNFAARVVTGLRKFEHITPVLRDLNWLPVNSMLK